MPDALLQENGLDNFLLEDGSGIILLESPAILNALLQENGFQFELEDGTGVILLETFTPSVAAFGRSARLGLMFSAFR